MTTLTIGWTEAVRAQVVLLRRTGRVRMLFTTSVLILLTMAFLFRSAASDVFAHDGFMLLWVQPFLVAIGAAWGIAVWWHEPPERREQLLMLPAHVSHHELARITAGALWLFAMIALTAIAAILMQMAAGYAEAVADVSPASWLSPFSGPLLAYTLTATIATAARRSIEMVLLGLMLLTATYAVLMQRLMVEDAHVAFDTMARFSLFTALGGFITKTVTNTTYAADGRVLKQQQTTFNADMMAQWEFATVLWWAVAACLLAFVLWRRRSA